MQVKTVVTIVLLLSAATLFAQTNPADRPSWSRGVFLNFEEAADLVEEVEVKDFDCNGVPIFEQASNPKPVSKPDDFPFNSTNVGKITTTACTWEGIYLNKEFVLDFSIRPHIWVDVFPPEAGKRVALKIEDSKDNTVFKQVELLTTVAKDWERLVFDFSGTESNKYSRIVLLFDFEGTAVGDIWYFDNIRQAQPRITYDNGVIEDFETPYKMFWGDWGGCEFTISENPNKTGINTSGNVGVFYTTAEQWEGACNAERLYPLDFAAAMGGSIKVKVMGPVGQRLMVKIENTYNKGDQPIENPIALTEDYQWEEIDFDFTERVLALPEKYHSDFYDRIAIFPDFGSARAGEDWYIDDIVWTGQPTKVVQKTNPAGYELSARNYPNPFNPTTTISYSLPVASQVELAVYDLSGRRVVSLVNEKQTAGAYDVLFNAASLPSGAYFYRLTTDRQTLTNKMLLIK